MGEIRQSVQIGMRKYRVTAIIDTGAEDSVIRADVAAKAGVMEWMPTTITHSDGKEEKTRKVSFPLFIKSQYLSVYAKVSRLIPDQLILGQDFLQMYAHYIDLKWDKLVLNEYAPRMYEKGRLR